MEAKSLLEKPKEQKVSTPKTKPKPKKEKKKESRDYTFVREQKEVTVLFE